MLIRRLFSNKFYSLSDLMNDDKYKNSLSGIEKLISNERSIKEVGLGLTSALLMSYMNHPLTVVSDRFSLHIIKEKWFEPKYRPLINGLDMQDLLLIDLDTSDLYMFDVDRPREMLKVKSIKDYIMKVLFELKSRALELGYGREVKKYIEDYKKLCL